MFSARAAVPVLAAALLAAASRGDAAVANPLFISAPVSFPVAAQAVRSHRTPAIFRGRRTPPLQTANRHATCAAGLRMASASEDKEHSSMSSTGKGDHYSGCVPPPPPARWFTGHVWASCGEGRRPAAEQAAGGQVRNGDACGEGGDAGERVDDRPVRPDHCQPAGSRFAPPRSPLPCSPPSRPRSPGRAAR